MPHLSEMQARYAEHGVTVIGSTKPDEQNTLEAVKTMTEQMGDRMAYTVGFDGAGGTYKTYMDAAGQGGIPTSFLVDREGRVAFIGHPSMMDLPLARVVAGSWDIEDGPAEVEAMYAELGRLYRYTGGGLTDEQKKTVLTGLAEFEEDYPEMHDSTLGFRFSLYLSAGAREKVHEIGGLWVRDALAHEDAAGLNQLAWTIVDPESDFEQRDLGLALYAATAACQFSGWKDPAILDTLARTHAWMGDWMRACEVQEKAVQYARKLPGTMAEELLPSLEDALDEYLAELDDLEHKQKQKADQR